MMADWPASSAKLRRVVVEAQVGRWDAGLRAAGAGSGGRLCSSSAAHLAPALTRTPWSPIPGPPTHTTHTTTSPPSPLPSPPPPPHPTPPPQMRLLKALDWRLRLDLDTEVWPCLHLLFSLGAPAQQAQQQQRAQQQQQQQDDTAGPTTADGGSGDGAPAGLPPPSESWAAGMHAYCANIRLQVCRVVHKWVGDQRLGKHQGRAERGCITGQHRKGRHGCLARPPKFRHQLTSPACHRAPPPLPAQATLIRQPPAAPEDATGPAALAAAAAGLGLGLSDAPAGSDPFPAAKRQRVAA